jgi:hypothetical protein
MLGISCYSLGEGLQMQHHIDIEDTSTWPNRFLEIMSGNKELFIAFHTEEKRVDKLAREDVALRMNRGSNPHASAYKDVLFSLANILHGENIVGYHCTRLAAHEIENIKSNGMKILTKELVEERFKGVLKIGLLREEQYQYISSSELFKGSLNNECGQRTGYIWFCPNRSTLKDGGAVCRLFQSWGGEAVYNGHEEDKNIGHHLKSIGAPCIVKCSMPMTDIEDDLTYMAKRFVSQFISNNGSFAPDPSAVFDMSIERDLLPSEVLEVIDFSDPRFLEITDHQSWYDKVRL